MASSFSICSPSKASAGQACDPKLLWEGGQPSGTGLLHLCFGCPMHWFDD